MRGYERREGLEEDAKVFFFVFRSFFRFLSDSEQSKFNLGTVGALFDRNGG